jgi:nitroreductase/NAD-dependent dihydropyrimidine dehydrogenase PreA subunit
MNLFDIDRDKCNQDGICSAVCPAGLIVFQKGDYPEPIPDAEEYCIRCGHCVAVCPTGSFSHSEIPIAECPPFREELRLNVEHCENFLRGRRSIRAYKDKKVPRDEMKRLIELARFAPSGHNSQCCEWLVIDDRSELKSLAGIVIEWMRWVIKEMPELAQMLHMERTIERWEKGTDVILRDAPAVVVSHAEKDHRAAPFACTIALSYMELAATSMGLGCCWAGYFHAAATTFPKMIKALSLPKGHASFGSMMVGYPKFKYQRLPPRNPPPITWR